MKYWIREGVYTEMPWYHWLVCTITDWYDCHIATRFGLSDSHWPLGKLSEMWCDIIHKYKEHKHEVHDDSKRPS